MRKFHDLAEIDRSVCVAGRSGRAAPTQVEVSAMSWPIKVDLCGLKAQRREPAGIGPAPDPGPLDPADDASAA
jgi:hypothetical protein